MEHIRLASLRVVFDLLAGNPEQENLLLSILVNKLGDLHSKVASKASYFLLSLITEHPGMKGVLLLELRNFLFRPNVSPKSRFYALVTMNQFLLRTEEKQIATEMMKIYLQTFEIVAKE